MSKEFIEQTAKDYDLPFEIVKDVYDQYYIQFYEKLEEIIRIRSLNK